MIASRRSLTVGLLSVVAVTPGIAASVTDLVPADPDAELIALASRLEAGRRAVSIVNCALAPTDDEIKAAVAKLNAACDAIVAAPRATTTAGQAVKAAAVMHQLAFVYCSGEWPGTLENIAWGVLSDIAGPAYVDVASGASVRPDDIPTRRPWA